MSEKKCWVCLRITPEQTLKWAHQIWTGNPKTAREIGLKMSEIIEKCYAERPIFFCGKSTRAVVSGLFYLQSFFFQAPVTMRHVSEVLSTTEPSVRRQYRAWLAVFSSLFQDFDFSLRNVSYFKPGIGFVIDPYGKVLTFKGQAVAGTAQCPFCGKIYQDQEDLSSERRLRAHISAVHGKWPGQKIWYCKVCKKHFPAGDTHFHDKQGNVHRVFSKKEVS